MREDLVVVGRHLMGATEGREPNSFSRMRSERMRGNSMSFIEGNSGLT